MSDEFYQGSVSKLYWEFTKIAKTFDSKTLIDSQIILVGHMSSFRLPRHLLGDTLIHSE